MYQDFAYIYDALMDETYNQNWLNLLKKYKPYHYILDLGCGTGSIAIELAKNYDVDAIDISKSMIEVAQIKAKQEHVDVYFIEADMLTYQTDKQYDLIYSFCDVINYLLTKEDVLKMFKRVHQLLTNDGLFLFDFHSLYKINHILDDYHQYDKEDDYLLDWKVTKEKAGFIKHELFFEDFLDPIKVKETHYQQTYSIKEYEALLNEAGLKIQTIYTDFEEGIQIDGERYILVVGRD